LLERACLFNNAIKAWLGYSSERIVHQSRAALAVAAGKPREIMEAHLDGLPPIFICQKPGPTAPKIARRSTIRPPKVCSR